MATPVHTVYSATSKCVSLHSILLEGVASSIIIVLIFSYLINLVLAIVKFTRTLEGRYLPISPLVEMWMSLLNYWVIPEKICP
jgi:hypothetical protein